MYIVFRNPYLDDPTYTTLLQYIIYDTSITIHKPYKLYPATYMGHYESFSLKEMCNILVKSNNDNIDPKWQKFEFDTIQDMITQFPELMS